MEKLQELISEGLTIPQIAEKMGKSPSSICRLLKKFGLKTKRFINRDTTANHKICRYCDEEKEIEEFSVAVIVKGKIYRRHKCNKCYGLKKADRRRLIANWLQDYKKNLSCCKCNNSDFRVLDFHHKEDNKEFNVSDGVKFSKRKILEEIEKCDVMCSNCHRIETYEERMRNLSSVVQCRI